MMICGWSTGHGIALSAYSGNTVGVLGEHCRRTRGTLSDYSEDTVGLLGEQQQEFRALLEDLKLHFNRADGKPRAGGGFRDRTGRGASRLCLANGATFAVNRA
jgi:hypothetical protein